MPKKKSSTSSKKRATVFNQKVADNILASIANGKSVRSVCEKAPAPTRTMFYKWIRENEQFRKDYERAIELRSDHIAEEILQIADDTANDYVQTVGDNDLPIFVQNNVKVQRDRLRIDSRKWLLARMSPKKYGDHLKVDADNNHSGAIKIVFDESYDRADDTNGDDE